MEFPFNLQQQPPPPPQQQQQQYSQILPQQYQFSNRRNSLIDSSNIWSTNPTSSSLGGNTSGISTSIGGNNMWSSSNLFLHNNLKQCPNNNLVIYLAHLHYQHQIII